MAEGSSMFKPTITTARLTFTVIKKQVSCAVQYVLHTILQVSHGNLHGLHILYRENVPKPNISCTKHTFNCMYLRYFKLIPHVQQSV